MHLPLYLLISMNAYFFFNPHIKLTRTLIPIITITKGMQTARYSGVRLFRPSIHQRQRGTAVAESS